MGSCVRSFIHRSSGHYNLLLRCHGRRGHIRVIIGQVGFGIVQNILLSLRKLFDTLFQIWPEEHDAGLPVHAVPVGLGHPLCQEIGSFCHLEVMMKQDHSQVNLF